MHLTNQNYYYKKTKQLHFFVLHQFLQHGRITKLQGIKPRKNLHTTKRNLFFSRTNWLQIAIWKEIRTFIVKPQPTPKWATTTGGVHFPFSLSVNTICALRVTCGGAKSRIWSPITLPPSRGLSLSSRVHTCYSGPKSLSKVPNSFQKYQEFASFWVGFFWIKR